MRALGPCRAQARGVGRRGKGMGPCTRVRGWRAWALLGSGALREKVTGAPALLHQAWLRMCLTFDACFSPPLAPLLGLPALGASSGSPPPTPWGRYSPCPWPGARCEGPLPRLRMAMLHSGLPDTLVKDCQMQECFQAHWSHWSGKSLHAELWAPHRPTPSALRAAVTSH